MLCLYEPLHAREYSRRKTIHDMARHIDIKYPNTEEILNRFLKQYTQAQSTKDYTQMYTILECLDDEEELE